MSPLRVLIADDHQVVRMGIAQVIAATADLELAGEATNGNELLARLRDTAADVILTDLAMPGISGMDLIRRILVERPAAAILVHSMYSDGQTASRALRAGARGYVTKGSDASTLIEGICKVAAGRRFVSRDLMDEVLASLTADGNGEPHERLTEREFEVFRMFVAGQSVGAIATALSLSPKTVSTHKVRLMHKLGAKSDTELVRYAMANGLGADTPLMSAASQP